MLHGVRKAYASRGDDVTFSRFVKVTAEEQENRKWKGAEHDEAKHRRQRRQLRLPGFEADFIRDGRTKFKKSVKPLSQTKNLLVSGHSNVKIGRDVRKGKLKGYWIYTLSLEERATCPRSCQHWQTCYGNNMPFAQRVDHTDIDFLPRLEREVEKLCTKRKGILIRLHALGDFYSVEYVNFWIRMLGLHQNLALYGYTAHRPGSNIGWEIGCMNALGRDRSMVRYSNGQHAVMSTVSIGGPESVPANAFLCPEQTNKTRGCGTCALCWSTTKNVAFMEH